MFQKMFLVTEKKQEEKRQADREILASLKDSNSHICEKVPDSCYNMTAL